MRLILWKIALLAGLAGLVLSACNYAAPGQAAGPTQTSSGTTPVTDAVAPTSTATLAPATETPPAAITEISTLPPATGETSGPPIQTQAAAPTACPPDLCTYTGLQFMQRPIAEPGNDDLDVTYRFGTTQGKLRDPHHGEEMLNPFGTPVLAAGDGTVVVAGQDMSPTSAQGVWPITFYGPYSNFYGNLVVIEHTLPPGVAEANPALTQPVYSLYGHLSEIEVQVGQPVTAGQEIGKVGQAGIATGAHLHFEVRVGENSYKASSNPELWLAPKPGASTGAIAGSFIDSYGNLLEIDSIVLEHLPDGPDAGAAAAVDFQVTVMTYEEKALLGRPPFNDTFAVGDLPAGWYRLSFPMGGLREELVQVLPGAVTVVTYRPR